MSSENITSGGHFRPSDESMRIVEKALKMKITVGNVLSLIEEIRAKCVRNGWKELGKVEHHSVMRNLSQKGKPKNPNRALPWLYARVAEQITSIRDRIDGLILEEMKATLFADMVPIERGVIAAQIIRIAATQAYDLIDFDRSQLILEDGSERDELLINEAEGVIVKQLGFWNDLRSETQS